MAGRFMVIKKIVIPFMTLVIMTSQLAGCATMSSQEMLEGMEESPGVSIEWATPDPSQSGQDRLDATGVVDVGGQQFVTDAADPDIGVIGNQGDEEKVELSGDALIGYFQLTYDSCSALDSSSLEEQISFELDMLQSFCDTDGEKLPANYADQYRAWRPVDQQTSNQQQAPEVILTFSEVTEQVWATGTVNLRSGPSTDDEKVGSLSKNQSVTRTGIGTGDYSSWSRVKLSDGTEVYVASSYLTTTKPSAGNTHQGGNNTQNTTQPGSQQQGQPGSQSQGTYDPDADVRTDPYAGMTPEEKAAQIEADRQATQNAIDQTQGTMSD